MSAPPVICTAATAPLPEHQICPPRRKNPSAPLPSTFHLPALSFGDRLPKLELQNPKPTTPPSLCRMEPTLPAMEASSPPPPPPAVRAPLSDQGKLFVGGIAGDTQEADLRSHFEKYGEVPAAALVPLSKQGKLFVGGIAGDTQEADLRSHFEKYGEVPAVAIPRDRFTGRPRGFGFVQFVQPEHAERALEEKHTVNGRLVEVKKAEPRSPEPTSWEDISSNPMSHHQSPNQKPCKNREDRKKIFIGGLPADFEEDKLVDYFKNFGAITDAVVITDASSRRSRGFGFVAFDSEECVGQVMQNRHHYLCGAKVEVKRARPKDSKSDRTTTASSNLSKNASPFYPRGYALSNGYIVPSPYYNVGDQLAGYSVGVPVGMGNCNSCQSMTTSMDQGLFMWPPLFPYGTAIVDEGYASGGFIGYLGSAGASCQKIARARKGKRAEGVKGDMAKHI